MYPPSISKTSATATLRGTSVSIWLSLVLLLYVAFVTCANADPQARNCLCECGSDSSDRIYADLGREGITVESPSQCTQRACQSMSNCPSEGSHNPGVWVRATPVDCTCHCCKTNFCADDAYAFFPTPNGRSSECTREVCSQRSECTAYPVVTATYSSLGSSSSGLSGGAIAGIVIGVIAGVALLAVAVYLLLPRRTKGGNASWTSTHDQMYGAQGNASSAAIP